MFNFKSNLRDVWRDDVYNYIMPKILEYKHYLIAANISVTHFEM